MKSQGKTLEDCNRSLPWYYNVTCDFY